MNWTKLLTLLCIIGCIWTVAIAFPQVAAIVCALVFTVAAIDVMND